MSPGEVIAVGIAICFAIALCLAALVLGFFAVQVTAVKVRKCRRKRAALGPAPADLAGRVPLSARERLTWAEFCDKEKDLSETGRKR